MRTPHALLAFLLLSGTGAVRAEALDILACGTPERQAVTPTDKLDCEWKNGNFKATLAQLYHESWRMVDTEFFDATRQVIYLERPEAAAPAAAPTATP